MHKHCAMAFAVSLVLIAPLSAWSAEPDIKQGEWEMTTTVEGGMMPQPMTFTTRQCLTKENYLLQTSPEGTQSCKVKNTSVKGNTVSWTVDCPSGERGPISGQGEITYRDTSYEGTMRITMQMEGRPATITQKLRGRYIGECK